MDPSVTANDISDWICRRVEAAGAEGVVVGLSGGIDSTVVAALAGATTRLTGLILPCGSDPQDQADARLAASEFCSQVIDFDLTATHGVLAQLLDLYNNDRSDNLLLPLANLKARLRMAILYFFANATNLLVCGTTNKSELLIGYFTKYGDGGADIEPIVNLWKTDVYALARYLDIPAAIIEKPPTAGLWSGQTDERELGMTYTRLDFFLKVICHAVQQGEAVEPELVTGADQGEFGRVIELFKRSQHKRELPSCCVLAEGT